MIYSVAIALAAVGVNAQASWNRRVYYDDLGCNGNMVQGIQVYYPITPCAPGSPAEVTVNRPCEAKNMLATRPSSEGTTCQPLKPSEFSDAPYFPPVAQGPRVASAPYVVINEYSGTGAGCALEGIASLEQRQYVADGQCRALERDEYFKATCDGERSTVSICGDADCNNCYRVLNFDGTCQTAAGGLPRKGVCIRDFGFLNPATNTSGSGSTPSGSGTQGSTKASAPAAKKNSAGGKEEGVFGGILGLLVVYLFG